MKFLNILLLSMSLLFVSCDEDTKEDIKKLIINSFKSSFLTEREKKAWIEKI